MKIVILIMKCLKFDFADLSNDIVSNAGLLEDCKDIVINIRGVESLTPSCWLPQRFTICLQTENQELIFEIDVVIFKFLAMIFEEEAIVGTGSEIDYNWLRKITLRRLQFVSKKRVEEKHTR